MLPSPANDPREQMVMPYTLIAAEVSLYSGKARAYLRHKRVPFEELFASRKVLVEIVRPKTGLAMIPVLLTPTGEAVQDTTAIIDHVEAKHPVRSVYPSTPLLRLASLLLELYGDEWLLMPAMHYRWHYKRQNMRLIMTDFGQIVAPGLPALLHPLAGLPLAAYFGGNYGRALGINRHNRKAIERSYEAFLRDFNTHLGEYPYLLGARPSVGDFGFMGPLYAHLYRDPAPGQLMRRLAPRVASWVERMNATPTTNEDPGSFVPHDEPPPTLDPIFRRLFSEHWPVVADTIAGVDRWVRAHPNKPRISRFVGEHSFTIEGATTTRWIQSFTQWMAQRPLDAYHALGPEDRARADHWLARVGGDQALRSQPPTRVERVDNRLVPVRSDAR
ncbi:Glutathione S-transferase [Enhygromyxa salina]|uniref:Glutathione S-transferase n=1 Tax=Enhygromyxa salina TaxID=215803 RepID=A0A0C2A7Q9_9BACT|nr:glutathione S-transferase family protein [Enhygromyxa salina]KIG19653.1 Glutathione S-transferase [Enhygromyxa salina]